MAVLAVVANLIAEQGISIVEITRYAVVVPPPVETVEAPPPPVVPIAPYDPKAEVATFADAVDLYAGAVMARARLASPENDERVAAALRQLRDAQGAVERLNSPPNRTVPTALRRYRENGGRLVALADQHRTSIETYAAALALIDLRLGESVERGWRIFGRVLTRETVLQLRADYAAMERAFASLRAVDTADKVAARETLAQSEDAFKRRLLEHQRQFKRGEGLEWFEEITSELEQVGTHRLALVAVAQQLDDAEAAFVQTQADLDWKPEPIKETAPRERAPFVGPPAPKPFVGPPVEAFVDGLRAEPATRIARQETDAQKQLLLALLTAGVLIVVLLISVGTVRSIVVPIRRLLKATNELGKQGRHEPVPRGGIRELDTLGQSFNDMAEELLAARRDAQRQHLILEERVAERTAQLQELAQRDPLTGLPNRRHLLRLLEDALAGRQDRLVAVFFLDLDNFKNINDSMGHGFGDEVLKAVARRLRDLAADSGFAARLGGDEFTVVLTSARTVEDVERAGLALIACFQSTLPVANRDLLISTSVGASICPNHETGAEGLLKAADAALFRAKALGRSQLSMFTPELLAEAADKFTTEQGLRRAIEHQEFVLVFQPEINADTMRPARVEALLRWRLPDGRVASPSEFLAVAEESGLIAEIGDWVLRAAIQAAADWHHGEWADACVAINVSARQLLDYRFVDKVQALLREFDLPTRCIEIELTESVLQTGPATLDTLGRLRAAGIGTALDDFGTGYSSLASLENLPLTRIKLDKSLIDCVATSARSAAIARAIIWLCHSLGLDVTAEGVEKPEQLAVLLACRPLLLQGYLLCRPVASDDVVPELRRLERDLPALLSGGSDLSVETLLSTRRAVTTRGRGRGS